MFNKDSILVHNNEFTSCMYSSYKISALSNYICRDLYIFLPKNKSLFILPDKIKVDISGKVFKWYSSQKIWRFLVHYSHLSNLVFFKSIFFFKSVGKNRYVIFSKNKSYTYTLRKLLRCVRYSNLFTGRGIKYSPRKFFKKQGKISTYI